MFSFISLECTKHFHSYLKFIRIYFRLCFLSHFEGILVYGGESSFRVSKGDHDNLFLKQLLDYLCSSLGLLSTIILLH